MKFIYLLNKKKYITLILVNYLNFIFFLILFTLNYIFKKNKLIKL